MKPKNLHRKLYEYLVEEIGNQIVSGFIGPGDTLPNEDSLCQTYGVSRGVLREATKVLTQKGLISTRPKIGTQIQPRDNWNLFDADIMLWTLKSGHKITFFKKVTEVRRIIESEACRYAAERATPEEIARIQSWYEKLDATLDREESYNYDRYLDIDMAFHTSILNACHNELLAQIGHTMRQAVQMARKSDRDDIKAQRASLPHHDAMLAAIRGKKAQAAYDASQAMFEQVWKTLLDKEPMLKK